MLTTSRMKWPRLGLILSLPLTLLACGGGDFRDAFNQSDPKVRFVHAAPAGPVLTLSRGDIAQAGATDVAYKGASNYRTADRGTAQWRLRQSSNQAELASISVNTERGSRYAFVALQSSSTGGTDLISIRDPYTVAPAPTLDAVKIRFVHGAPALGDLDVYWTSTSADLRNTSPVQRDLRYRSARPNSGDDALEYSKNTYRLRLTEAGTRTVVFDADVELPSKGDWILVAVPAPQGGRTTQVLAARINRNDDAESTLEFNSR
jgi:hypothetical protein